MTFTILNDWVELTVSVMIGRVYNGFTAVLTYRSMVAPTISELNPVIPPRLEENVVQSTR